MTIPELLRDIGYGLVWFIAGYVVATVVENRYDKAHHVHHPGRGTMPNRAASTRRTTMPNRIVANRWGAAALIVLAVVSTTLSAINAVQRNDQTACFTRYNLAFIEAYRARAIAADQDRSALNRMILALNTPDAKARATAFQQYVQDIQDTEQYRKQHPLPEPPDPITFCTR